VKLDTQHAFVNLDHALTEKPLRECGHTCHNQSSLDVYALMTNLYYLSDGGYSRLRIAEDATVRLAQGARAEVQFNWEYAEREIAAVNKALAAELDAEQFNALCSVKDCGFYHLDGSEFCASHG